MVLNRGSHANSCSPIADGRRRDECSPMRDMHWLRHRHSDVAINARPRIPARTVAARVCLDRDNVLLAKMDIRRCIHPKGHVAVVPFPGEMSVDINLWKSHHAIEIEICPLTRAALQREFLPIPAHALPGKFPGGTRSVRIK